MWVRFAVGAQGGKCGAQGTGIGGSLGGQHIAQTVLKIADSVKLGAVALFVGVDQQGFADVGKLIGRVCGGGGLADTAL